MMGVAQTGGRLVVVAGASGLVGRAILEGLLADGRVAAVHTLGRKPSKVRHANLTSHVVDLAALPKLPALDEVYLALGTTIKVAGSQAAFRAIDFDANLAVARVALEAGARRCGLVSAMGANSTSRVFYSRVKGELEEALASLPFEGLVIVRPSLLLGERSELGQPERPGEKLGKAIGQMLGPLMPANYKPVAAHDVARVLLAHVPTAVGRMTILSGEIQALHGR
jgi:uncharacterized protein YbjT (DUF2867 family)